MRPLSLYLSLTLSLSKRAPLLNFCLGPPPRIKPMRSRRASRYKLLQNESFFRGGQKGGGKGGGRILGVASRCGSASRRRRHPGVHTSHRVRLLPPSVKESRPARGIDEEAASNTFDLSPLSSTGRGGEFAGQSLRGPRLTLPYVSHPQFTEPESAGAGQRATSAWLAAPGDSSAVRGAAVSRRCVASVLRRGARRRLGLRRVLGDGLGGGVWTSSPYPFFCCIWAAIEEISRVSMEPRQARGQTVNARVPG